jgi:2-keto-4-pentenoate hydratase/2-oxohepta-3-ene-1,7-dioic acid hydratase in catechol pathway
MKIGRVSYQGRERLALIDEAKNKAFVIEGGLGTEADPVLAVIQRGLKEADILALTNDVVDLDRLRFLAPIPRPLRNIFAVGKNYIDHSAEFDKSGFNATSGKSAIPEYPQFFSKATTTVIGPTDDVLFSPLVTKAIDYEGEIAVVIGRECRRASRESALDFVFGYMAVNDVTARDLQKNHAQWFLGKSLDTFCPMGPWIATADEITPETLRLETWVNGELRQRAQLKDLIFDIRRLIVDLSACLTLLPGDIIATGTPVGVGLGQTPPKFLNDGDRVRVSVNGLGSLENRFRQI